MDCHEEVLIGYVLKSVPIAIYKPNPVLTFDQQPPTTKRKVTSDFAFTIS